MSKSFTCDAEFLRSLAPRQSEYFLQRETARHIRLQSTLRDLSRGLSTVSELSGEAQAVVLAQSASRKLPDTGRRVSKVQKKVELDN